MKTLHVKLLLAAVLAITLSSCEKKADNIENLSEKQIAVISNVVYPLDGNESSTSILPKKEHLPGAILERAQVDEDSKVKVIDLVCEE